MKKNKKKPNIIMILCDHLRSDWLGCYGNCFIKTPNIDSLAAEGIMYNNCMITNPTCTPSRASILTGRLPSALRTRMVGCKMPEDEQTIADILKEHNYIRASIGKIHLQPQGEEWEVIKDKQIRPYQKGDDISDNTYYGFDYVDLVNGHGDYLFGHINEWAEKNHYYNSKDKVIKRNYIDGLEHCYEYPYPLKAHSSSYIAHKSEQFIDNIGNKPFMLHVSFNDPHPARQSFVVPKEYAYMYDYKDMPLPCAPVTESRNIHNMYLDSYKNISHNNYGDAPIGTNKYDYTKYDKVAWQKVRALYSGSVTLIDDCVGRILNKLKEKKLDENTIIVFLSDHGDYLGDHGLHGKGYHFDSVIRTPLLIKYGSNLKHDVVNNPISTLDIMPTLLQLIDIPEPIITQGISFADALLSDKDYTREYTITENDDNSMPFRLRTLLNEDYKLSIFANYDYGELFDRKNDPNELNNLYFDKEYEQIRNKLIYLMLCEVICDIDSRNYRQQKPAPPVNKWISYDRHEYTLYDKGKPID